MAKRLMSIVVTIAMVMTMFAGLSLTSSAAGETVLFTGSEALGAWDNDVSCDVTNVPGAAAGDKVTIEYTVDGADPQIQLIAKIGEGWTWTNISEVIDLPAGGSHSITLTAEQANYFATAKELLFKGQNATITKYTYGGTTSAV